ncbi:MAG: hypothetical protein EOP64_00220 [Sphingomonas sp.]|nr:MAG: hypothetical protein EOP64_00220 [Sphingomonas sp.]
MGEQNDMQVVMDYVSGMSLEAVASKQGMARSRVVSILKTNKVGRRTISESHRLAHQRIPPEVREMKTRAARASSLRNNRPRGLQAGAVLSWLDQGSLSLPHQALASDFRARGVQVQCNYPVGPHNLYLGVPSALLAIEPMPFRLTYKNANLASQKIAYVLRRGWFVSFLTDDPMVHFDSIVALARMRAGAPLDLGQKRDVQRAMEPFVKRLKAGHAAALQMAEAMVDPKQLAGSAL